MASDVYQALNEVGFEKYTNQLKEFMANYDQEKEDKKVAAEGIKRSHLQTTEELEEDTTKKLKVEE